MTKTPSPCIDVCKFKRKGHCIGCSMTKAQKSLFKGLKKNDHRTAFVEMLTAQQMQMGKYGHWTPAYLKKLKKRKIAPMEFLAPDKTDAAAHPKRQPVVKSWPQDRERKSARTT